MKITCTNIGPADNPGQIEWEGRAIDYSKEIDTAIKTASVPDENGNLVRKSRITDAGHNFVCELSDTDRRELAYRAITTYYPEWKQINIIRNGGTELDKMDAFINQIRSWSNDSNNNDPFALDNVRP